MAGNIHILSTAPLEQSLAVAVREAGIALDVLSFIEVVAVVDEQLNEQIKSLQDQPLAVVFTSANGVSAVADILSDTPPRWDIYCIGAATKNEVLSYFPFDRIKASAGNAADLADLIVKAGVGEVTFFCGDKRTDTLPVSLQEAGVKVHEIVVYRTMETPHKVPADYNGILFFSPSGLHSFLNGNNIPVDAVLFAIGNTTAAAIKERCGNRVIVSEAPSKEQVIRSAIQYFVKNNN